MYFLSSNTIQAKINSLRHTIRIRTSLKDQGNWASTKCSLSNHSTNDPAKYLLTLARISQMQVWALVLVGILLILKHHLSYILLRPEAEVRQLGIS